MLMDALRAVRSLGLESWCIGAGAVRNLVWDTLHGYAPSEPVDVDVACFDAGHLDRKYEVELEARLRERMPDVRWEAVNQARVYLWYPSGGTTEPFSSLEQALASWPEYATAVGVTLHADDSLGVVAPHGLDDLFDMKVRHNPAWASVDVYLQRCRQKCYAER